MSNYQSNTRKVVGSKIFHSLNTRTHISSHCKRACHPMPDAAKHRSCRLLLQPAHHDRTEPPDFLLPLLRPSSPFHHSFKRLHQSIIQSCQPLIQGYKSASTGIEVHMTTSDDTESTPRLASPRKVKVQQTGRNPKRLDRKTNEEMANMYRHSFPRSMPETQK